MPCSLRILRVAFYAVLFPGLSFFLSTNRAHAQAPDEYRALWVDAWNGDFVDATKCTKLINDTRAGNLNMLVIQARRRGDAFYNSKYEPKNTTVAANFDPLQDLLTKGSDTSGGKQKIEIHAWIVTYHIWNSATPPTQPDHPLNLHPEWLMKDVNGNTFIGGQYTFDPAHPDVQRHTYNVCMDLVTNYNVAGVNFDYVRYGGTSEGYHDVAVERFNRLYNRTGKPVTTDPDWKQFRRDQVTALVRKVYLSAIAERPDVQISADTITWAPGPTSDASWYSSSAAWNSVLQDWRGWMEEGILDLNIPMNYFRQTTHPADYVKWADFAKDRRFNRHLINGPGIYLNTVSNAIVQMRYSRETTPAGNKADGVCGYVYKTTNNEGVSTTTFLNALVAPSSYDPVSPPMFEQRANIPDMPWKTAPTKGHLKGFLTGGNATNFLDGASVTISGPVNRSFASDGTGFYGSVDLPPGNYSLTATFPGYLNAATNFTVVPGVVANHDLTLAVIPPVLPPSITTHPQSQTVGASNMVVFTVEASGTAPLSYQWRYNGGTIPGATESSYTRLNVQPSDNGDYSVVITNIAGSATSSNATLTVVIPAKPVFQIHPQSQTVNAGQSLLLTAAVTGSAPLHFQWMLNGSALFGATGTSLSLINVSSQQTGHYSVVASNNVAVVSSRSASVVVVPARKQILWRVSPGERPYLGTGLTERGMAYNPATGNVLLVSRASGTKIFVLNGDTGADLHELNTTTSIITGGTFTLNMIGVAEDGAVYAGNLATTTPPTYKLYRWANDSAASVPQLVYSGDPGLGNNQRWGDSMDVRGSGTGTQILLGSRSGSIVAVLTTANGTNFTATPVAIAGAPAGAFGLSVTFGTGDTFWGKSTVMPLRQCSFNLGAGSGTILQTFSTPDMPNSVVPIGYSPELNLLAGVAVETPDNLKLYHLGQTPVLLATNHFATDYENGFSTGSVDFGPGRVYALDSNNGLIACALEPYGPPRIEALSIFGNLLRFHLIPDHRNHILESSTDLIQWQPVTNAVPSGGYVDSDDSMLSPMRAYRLRVP
mgnify:CR=1 FL=1